MRKHFKNERHLGEASLVYYPPIWHAGIEIYYEATARAQDFPVEEFPRLGPPFLPSYFKHKKAKAGRKSLASGKWAMSLAHPWERGTMHDRP